MWRTRNETSSGPLVFYRSGQPPRVFRNSEVYLPHIFKVALPWGSVHVMKILPGQVKKEVTQEGNCDPVSRSFPV